MVSTADGGAVWAERIQAATSANQGWSFNKKAVLALFVFVQIAMILVIQWKYNGVFNLVQWTTPSASPKLNDARNFLGERVVAHIHRQHPSLGHTWEDTDDVKPEINVKDIAIGLAITSRNLYRKKLVKQWPFFTQLLTSFCKTASEGYNYHFFLAYDYNDAYFTASKLHGEFAEEFRTYTNRHCYSSSSYFLHFIQCSHKGKPANAQNDAMMAAYMLNMAYFYRVNDDSIMKTRRWTERFIQALAKYDPPNVGVVGPNHKGGNMAILTYDFVSTHHVNVFGCYYPHVFTDWWGDSWISMVYKPGRVAKLKDIDLTHTMTAGQRYHTHYSVKDHLQEEVDYGKMLILRYVEAMQRKVEKSPDHVIAMALYGNDPNFTYGAIRNAQLMPVLFPGWTLVIFIDSASNPNTNHTYTSLSRPNSTQDVATKFTLNPAGNPTEKIPNAALAVPGLVLNKLRTLGARIIPVDTAQSSATIWPYLAIDQAKYVLIRRPNSRLTAQDQKLVNDWLKTNATLMYTREKEYKNALPTGGNMAINTANLELQTTVEEYIQEKGPKATEENFLQDVLSQIESHMCFDSLRCKENNCLPFPTRARSKGEFFGQRYSIYDKPVLNVPTPNGDCIAKPPTKL